MKWISVKDKLPNEEQRVIYYFKHTGINVGKYMSTIYGPCFYGETGWLTDDVTHWMPLPEIPNE